MSMNFADAFYQSMLDSTQAANDVGRYLEGKVDWAHWRSGLRRDLRDCLGGFPDAVPLNIQRGDPVKKDGYTRERIQMQSEPGLTMPAYLLLPEGADANTPTAVALAGHGFGVADIVGITADGKEQGPEMNYHAKFAIMLAKKGFAVIAPELLGFGELRLERDIDPENPGGNSCDAISRLLLMVGRTTAGARVHQAMRCVDALKELGFHRDPVAMGISGGGLVCSYFTALDERVKACCVSGFANTYRGCILAMRHCIDNYQPGLLRAAEMSDVLSSIAPRPMLWEAGEKDPIFPKPHVLEAQGIVERVYASHGAQADFQLDLFDGGHEISGRVAYDFLWKHANEGE